MRIGTIGRRGCVRGMALALLVLSTTAGSTGSAGAAQGAGSGGLGLDLETFDQYYGPGEAGQSLMYFDTQAGYRLFVGVDDGLVSSIQFSMESSVAEPPSPEGAAAMVASLLPDDADLEERYTAPAIAPGTVTLVVETWESDWLEDQFDDDREQFTVVYSQTGLEPQITGISIIVED